jgi:hypothetical protein
LSLLDLCCKYLIFLCTSFFLSSIQTSFSSLNRSFAFAIYLSTCVLLTPYSPIIAHFI